MPMVGAQLGLGSSMWYLLALLSFCLTAQEIIHDFVFIVCSYNNIEWVERNLNSIFSQNYPRMHYRVIYVDDCSTDGTYEFVVDYKEKHQLGNRLVIVRNEKRKRKAHNLYMAGHLCKKHEIIIELDGDDWLPHERVLNILNGIYQDPQIWLTYGNNRKFPTGKVEDRVQELPAHIIENGSFRHYRATNFWTALRSYYAWLFQTLEKRDFMYSAKQTKPRWFEMSIDASIYFSMLEKARERHKFCAEPLYVHNIATSFNDHKVDCNLQYTIEMYLRRLTPYSRLSDDEAYHVAYYARN
jgi:glycosyltransferase involved in cell wall biosynthesis